MKKFYMLVLAAMMMAANVEAKVIMTESFDREVGTLNLGTNTQMGTNTSDWWSYSGSSNYIQVEEGTLSYPGYKTTGEGNKAKMVSGTAADDFRKFAAPVTNGKVYVAAIINVEELRQGTTGDYFLSLGNGGIGGTDVFARLSTKSVSDGNAYYGFRLGLNKVNESTTFMRYTDEVYSPKTDYLVVVEYEFVDGEKNDEVRLYVNPTKATTKATLVCVQDTTNAAGTSHYGGSSKDDASQIAAVYLRQGSNTPRQVYVDEIKVATSWADLFEEGGDTPGEDTPVINPASSIDFGDVDLNLSYGKTLVVSGSNLKGAVSVVSSNPALVPDKSSVTKAQAEAEGGYNLTIILTATEAGNGSATITLSSEGAESKVVNVSWNGLAPASGGLTIAEAKKLGAEAKVALKDVVVVRRFQGGLAFSVQDETGALNIADYYGVGTKWEEGDKISGITGFVLADEDAIDGFFTIYPNWGTVTASEVAIDPFTVTLSDFTQYGPAYIKVEGVSFPEDAETFAAGSIKISQGAASANLQIEAGCDIIGEKVPASADVKGIVCHPYFTDNIVIRESPDVYNRVPKGGDTPTPPVYENLILNPSFEEYSCNAIFGCSFDEWNMAMGSGSANSTDKLEGEVSLYMNPTSVATVLDQGVTLTDADYAAGSKFSLSMNYKVQSMPAGETLALDCYWEAAAGGSSEEIEAHESDILHVNLDAGSGWQLKELVTTKPAKSAYFRVRVKVPKNAKVLFDKFSLTYTPSTDPYIEVSPKTLPQFSLNLGETDSKTVHIRQGNITGVTTFELSGYNADQFQISASQMSSDQSELDLIITYAPTSAGTHSAILNIDNLNHTTLFQHISLSGTCSDPSATPVIALNPSTLPDFEVLEGKQQKMTFTVSSLNCTDYVYASVEHVQGAAFTIDGSMYSKNSTATVTVTFAPQTAGTYQSTVTFSSTGAENVTITLNGTGIAKTPETIDWQTDFVWDDTNPLKLLNEPFDDIQHGETFVKAGWQNVAAVDQRPWQGVDASTMQSITGDGKFVRASAYQYGQDSTANWETWLVTPALDYKNAASKIFAFSVMGMYMPEDGSSTLFEVYYIDATGATVYKQNLTASFDIPTTSDDNESWKTFYLDLEPYAETMADVFYMAFHYVGPNGNQGIVSYYVDDVSWGRTDLPNIYVTPSVVTDTTIVNVKKDIATISISSSNVEGAISLSLAGSNYNRFSLSATSLPAAGGEVTVSFEGQEAGVHEAYIVVSTKGAPDKYVVMAVLCKEEGTGFESVQVSDAKSQKILRDGRILILRDGKSFNLLGTRVE